MSSGISVGVFTDNDGYDWVLCNVTDGSTLNGIALTPERAKEVAIDLMIQAKRLEEPDTRGEKDE